MKKAILFFTALVIFSSLNSQAIYKDRITPDDGFLNKQHESPESQNVFTIEDIFRMKSVAEVAISPDGENIAFVLNVPRPFDHQPGGDYRELYVYNPKSGNKQAFITGAASVFSPGWTPDGAAVTFRTNLPKVRGVQVYAMNITGGEAYNLTQHTTSVRQYAFGNNNQLFFTAESPEDEQGRIFRNEGFDIEIFEEEFNHINLYVQDILTGEVRQLTHDVTVFDFAAQPGGKAVAAAVAPNNLVDDSYMFRRIHLVDVESASNRLLVDNPGKLGKMIWNSNGNNLATD